MSFGFLCSSCNEYIDDRRLLSYQTEILNYLERPFNVFTPNVMTDSDGVPECLHSRGWELVIPSSLIKVNA